MVLLIRKLLILALIFLVYPAGQVAAIELKSTLNQTILVELFTSQGCSSCPPAEAYLNRFQHHEQLWTVYIPVAFHVDYWDYLGWKDRFGHPQHRAHQEEYAQINRQSTIYTPGFYVNGKPWRRGWRNAAPAVKVKPIGVLQVRLQDRKIEARYEPVAAQPEAKDLHIAVLGMGLSSQIEAGENAGRHSAHEFVVLHYQRHSSSNQQWSIDLPEATPADQRMALVAWVSQQGDPRPLQSVGGYLEKPEY